MVNKVLNLYTDRVDMHVCEMSIRSDQFGLFFKYQIILLGKIFILNIYFRKIKRCVTFKLIML